MQTNEATKTLIDHKIRVWHDFGWNKTVLDALDTAIEALSADVVARDCYDRLLAENDALRKERPVRHGRWIDKPYTGGRRPTVIRYCSLCGHNNNNRKTNYCPNCGAKMDG
jgi:ribosomal protein L37E